MSDSSVTVITPDDTIISTQQGSKISLQANTSKLVQLKKIVTNGVITYRLYGYNADTQNFDIPLGEEIVPGTSSGSNSNNVNITSAVINGQRVRASVNSLGQLIIDNIPASAIQFYDDYMNPETGRMEPYESIIDGNA